MSGGEFTQVLHGVRMNNQRGKGAKIKFGNAITKHFKDKEEEKEKDNLIWKKRMDYHQNNINWADDMTKKMKEHYLKKQK